MWQRGWRDQVWSSLDESWDLIVIGGGITGAGILREAASAGLRVLLLEMHDFASGTSSRSTKLVHGGVRYLQNAQIKLTYESVRERERLLREGRGLIMPLGFLLANYRRDSIPGWVFGAGLAIFDLLAFHWSHRHYDAYDIGGMCPNLCEDGLVGGYRYFDAQTDDSRLVLRLIQEAVREGGAALNYFCVTGLLRDRLGQVCGVIGEDRAPGAENRLAEVRAGAVINATGPWADQLRLQAGGRERLRKLRGSHLIFPAQRLPLTRAISMLHPQDGRPVMAIPWEGVTLVGTTDVDHLPPLETDLAISPAEVDYLLAALKRFFPAQELSIQDIQATFAGVRPVVNTGKANPSKESREHVLWCENGLLTVAGGKLTTFRLMALTALRAVCAQQVSNPRWKRLAKAGPRQRVLDPPPAEAGLPAGLSPATRLRLSGRYAVDAPSVIASAGPGELEAIPGTASLWAELRWAARAEAVIHLDDLLLRRVRLGLQSPGGGLPLLERIRSIILPELGWDDARWEQEVKTYTNLWKQCYHFGEQGI